MKNCWIVREEYTLNEVMEIYPELWSKIGHMFNHLVVEDGLDMFNLIVYTCHHCYSDNKICVCWNDM